MFTKTQEIINATTDTYVGALRRLRGVLLAQVVQVDAQIKACTEFGDAAQAMPDVPEQGSAGIKVEHGNISVADPKGAVPDDGKDLKFIRSWAQEQGGVPLKRSGGLADDMAAQLGLPKNGVESQGA